MERRKINLNPNAPAQLALGLPDAAPTRRRITPDPQDDTQTLQMRVPAGIAAFVDRNPAVVAKHLEETAAKELAVIAAAGNAPPNVTDWVRSRPESSGFWEIKQQSAREPDPVNWWYSALNGNWTRTAYTKPVPHASFMLSHEWRGLTAPWPGGYTYELERAPFSAPAQLGNAAVPDTKVNGAFERAGMNDLNPGARRRVVL